MIKFKEFVGSLDEVDFVTLKEAVRNRETSKLREKAKEMPALTDEEKSLITPNRRFTAIKAYRDRVGCSLLEAHAVVHLYRDNI